MTPDDVAAARRSWERVMAQTDPDGQRTMIALWASVYAEKLLQTCEAALPAAGSGSKGGMAATLPDGKCCPVPGRPVRP